MNTGERIKKLRKTLDLTQQKFGERLGIKGNTVAQYELGRSNPVDSVFSLICREFNVNEEWLRNGEGEMFKPKSYDILDQLADKYNLSTTDRAVIDKFLSMDPKARKEMLDYFYNFVAILTHEPEPPQPMESYKKLKIEASDPEISVEQAEAEYIKSRLNSARKTTPFVSNTIEENTKKKNA